MTVTSVDKDVDRLTFTLVAEFDAPIERVWQLWADPRKLERWWGPPGAPAIVEDSREQMEKLVSMEAIEGMRQAVGQMDDLLAG